MYVNMNRVVEVESSEAQCSSRREDADARGTLIQQMIPKALHTTWQQTSTASETCNSRPFFSGRGFPPRNVLSYRLPITNKAAP